MTIRSRGVHNPHNARPPLAESAITDTGELFNLAAVRRASVKRDLMLVYEHAYGLQEVFPLVPANKSLGPRAFLQTPFHKKQGISSFQPIPSFLSRDPHYWIAPPRPPNRHDLQTPKLEPFAAMKPQNVVSFAYSETLRRAFKNSFSVISNAPVVLF